MSIIQAYKSDADGKLFEDKKKYVKHLKALAKDRLVKRKIAKMERERDVFLDQMGQVTSIDELKQFIKDNWKWFWQNGDSRQHWRDSHTPEFHEYVDVDLIDVRWSEKVSNSHSCPRNGVQNFDTRSEHNKGKPTGYPGWTGRIVIKVKPPMHKYKGKEYMRDGYGSDYFERTIIHTGSGGGGGGEKFKSYQYDLRLFAADFPVMHEQVRREQWIHRENAERNQVWKSLGGNGKIVEVTEIPQDWVCPDPMLIDEVAYNKGQRSW